MGLTPADVWQYAFNGIWHLTRWTCALYFHTDRTICLKHNIYEHLLTFVTSFKVTLMTCIDERSTSQVTLNVGEDSRQLHLSSLKSFQLSTKWLQTPSVVEYRTNMDAVLTFPIDLKVIFKTSLLTAGVFKPFRMRWEGRSLVKWRKTLINANVD